MSIAGALFQSVLQRSNPTLVPAGNRRLERWISEHPGEAEARIEAAIERATGYFAALPKIDLAALILLGRLHRTGAEKRLHFVEHSIAAFREGDPHLRLLDPYHAPSSDEVARASAQYTHPVLQLMVRCLYADRNGDGLACLEQLSRIDDGGGYGTTHVVVGGLILRGVQAAPDHAVETLIQSTAPSLITAQACDRAGDLFAERICVLQWLGCHGAIAPAWIQRLARAQRKDGGWAPQPSLRRANSSQHASALALVSLVQWTRQRAARYATSETLPSELFWNRISAAGTAERAGAAG
jgi:hypothetical protein